MAHSLPPFDAMQAVLAAARAGSFSGAANELEVTHGAISRRVAAVEAWAGITLFVRHGRGVRLTFEGQRLASRIERAVALIEDGRANGPSEAALDIVRVGVVQSFARLWLFPHLAALEGQPPDLRIEPEIDHRYMTLSDARIAIRYGRGDWPGVVAEPLFRERLVPLAHRDIAAALGRAPRAGALLAYPLIHDATEEAWRLYLSRQGAPYERRPRDRLFDDYDLALLAAAHGHGIVLGRLPYCDRFVAANGLLALPVPVIDNPLAFHIVMQPGARYGAVERLVERLRQIAAQEESAPPEPPARAAIAPQAP